MSDMHPLAERYVARLATEARRLPAADAHELTGDIVEHLSAATGPASSEADVRTVLDRLGTPAEVVAAMAPHAAPLVGQQVHAPAQPTALGRIEVGALVCLMAAELLAILLPFAALLWVAGLALLLSSSLWRPGEKVLGALGLVTGFPVAVVLLLLGLGVVATSSESCVTGPQGGTHCTTTGDSGHAHVVITLVLVGIFLAFQIYTIWRLVHAERIVRDHAWRHLV